MTDPTRPPGLRYLTLVGELLDRLERECWLEIRRAATLVADAIAGGHDIHAFGSGHSHMLAEELFYRAGGLVRVRPILFEGLMLHASAPLSTSLERLPDVADALAADHAMVAGDVLIAASNSGGNAVAARLVQIAHERDVRVVAVTSIRHATSSEARANDLPRLHELADVVIDNGGTVGDAAIEIAGLDRKVGPTSTVIGAAIVNAIVAEAAGILVERGIVPDVYTSSNTEGGDAANLAYIHPAVAR